MCNQRCFHFTQKPLVDPLRSTCKLNYITIHGKLIWAALLQLRLISYDYLRLIIVCLYVFGASVSFKLKVYCLLVCIFDDGVYIQNISSKQLE